MDVIKLLEYLQEILETSSKLPMSNKIMVNKKEVNEIIEQIINCLPDELKKAAWICDEKEKIIRDAQEQAEEIKKEAVEVIRRKIETHDLVKSAEDKGEKIIFNAQKKAKIIKSGTKEYSLGVLHQIDSNINETYDNFMKNMEKEMDNFKMNVENQLKETISNLEANIDEINKL